MNDTPLMPGDFIWEIVGILKDRSCIPLTLHRTADGAEKQAKKIVETGAAATLGFVRLEYLPKQIND